jgi:hypothetical protein
MWWDMTTMETVKTSALYSIGTKLHNSNKVNKIQKLKLHSS